MLRVDMDGLPLCKVQKSNLRLQVTFGIYKSICI